jgi:hypothetical protein
VHFLYTSLQWRATWQNHDPLRQRGDDMPSLNFYMASFLVELIRNVIKWVCSVASVFVLSQVCLFCRYSFCCFQGYIILLYIYFALFYVILYYSMYSFILFYVTSECICVQATATGCLPNCSLQKYQYQNYTTQRKLTNSSKFW